MNTMTYQRSRGLATVAIVLIVSLCVVACGSSSTSSTASSSSAAAASTGQTAARTKLAACLKQHGVTLPSRPAGQRPGGGSGGGYGGGGGFLGGGGQGAGAGRAGARFSNPKFRAAVQACGGMAGFRRGRGNFRPSAAAITKFASCVKQHGYALPKANLTGKGPIYPVTIEKDAKFQAASKACASDLRPAGGAGPGGGGAPPAA